MATLGNSNYFIFTPFPKRMNFSIVAIYLRGPFSDAENAKQKYITFEKCWASTTGYWRSAVVYVHKSTENSDLCRPTSGNYVLIPPNIEIWFFHPAEMFDKHGQPYVFNGALHRDQPNQYLRNGFAFLCRTVSKSETRVTDLMCCPNPKPLSSSRISVAAPNRWRNIVHTDLKFHND